MSSKIDREVAVAVVIEIGKHQAVAARSPQLIGSGENPPGTAFEGFAGLVTEHNIRRCPLRVSCTDYDVGKTIVEKIANGKAHRVLEWLTQLRSVLKRGDQPPV